MQSRRPVEHPFPGTEVLKARYDGEDPLTSPSTRAEALRRFFNDVTAGAKRKKRKKEKKKNEQTGQ